MLNEALGLIPLNNNELLGLTYNNIGCVYKQQQKTELALQNL